MDLAKYLMNLGLSAPTAGLWATLGVCAVLILLGVACVAYIEGLELRSQRTPPLPPRGATRHKPGQPGKV